MKRAIVTGCDEGFVAGARGLLTSARAYHPEASRYCYAPPGQEEAVQRGLGDVGTVLAMPRLLRGIPTEWLPQIQTARVFMTRLLEDVIAWVDCDAVFCRPANELFEVAPGQVNVVQDAVYNLGMMVVPGLWEYYEKQFGLPKTHPGFNSGVFALRKSDWPNLAEQFEEQYNSGGYPFFKPGFDQAFLNGLFQSHIKWLPRQFNCHAIYELGIPADVRILHYTASPKPWQPGYGLHNRGYAEWVTHAEQCSALRSAWLRAYYHLMAPRRLGYRAIRKALTLAGLWQHNKGVS